LEEKDFDQAAKQALSCEEPQRIERNEAR